MTNQHTNMEVIRNDKFRKENIVGCYFIWSSFFTFSWVDNELYWKNWPRSRPAPFHPAHYHAPSSQYAVKLVLQLFPLTCLHKSRQSQFHKYFTIFCFLFALYCIMFLLDWFWSLLFSLGFFNKNATVLVLGECAHPSIPTFCMFNISFS